MWRKSNYGSVDGACPEVEWLPLSWRKSRYSPISASDCVEVAMHDTVYVRDSKNTGGEVLDFSSGAWTRFLRSL